MMAASPDAHHLQPGPDVDAFIRDSIAAARDHWNRNGGEELRLRLGRARIAVRVSGAPLRDVILPALGHALDAGPGFVPDAIVHAIDAAATGFPMPPDNWPFDTSVDETRTRTRWNPAEGPVMTSDETRGIWHLHDMASQTGLYWIRSSEELPGWETGSPLRHHVHWASSAVGQQMLHAAVVSNGQGGALLAGPGGSGKSTLTAAALRAGWQVTGDDFVLIATEPFPVSYRLYDMIKLTGMAEEIFGEYAGAALNPRREKGEKLLANISTSGGGAFVPELPVTALFSLSLTGEASSRIEPASRFELVRALAPNTSAILRTGLHETFAFASALVRDLPCFSLRAGRDPMEALGVLGDFLAENRS